MIMRRARIRMTFEALLTLLNTQQQTADASIENIVIEPDRRMVDIFLVAPDTSTALYGIAEGQTIPCIGFEVSESSHGVEPSFDPYRRRSTSFNFNTRLSPEQMNILMGETNPVDEIFAGPIIPEATITPEDFYDSLSSNEDADADDTAL